MHFTRLRLDGFRNYAGLDVALGPRVNCLYGPNGMGKTNLLEALHTLAVARGFAPERDAIGLGHTYFQIDGWLSPSGPAEAPARVTASYMAGRGRKVLWDGQPLPKLSAHLGRIPLVCILPDDTDLARGAPEGRRRWLDLLIAQSDAVYLQHLIQFEKALDQRNALLKQALNDHRPPDPALLELWEAPLAAHGAAVVQARLAFVLAFSPVFTEFYQAIAPERPAHEAPALAYEPKPGTEDPAQWPAILRADARRDAALGRTHTGPHRHDLAFSLGTQPLKAVASQGQRKTFVAALKFAETAFLETRTEKPPILLLDDLFDKLDAHRVERLSELVCTRFPHSQIFATDTSPDRLRSAFGRLSGLEVEYYAIRNGQIEHRG